MKLPNQSFSISRQTGIRGWKPYRDITTGECRSLLEFLDAQTERKYAEGSRRMDKGGRDFDLYSNQMTVRNAILIVYEAYLDGGHDLLVMVTFDLAIGEFPGSIARYKMKNGVVIGQL